MKYEPSDRQRIPEDLAGDPRKHIVTGKDKSQALLTREIIAIPSRKDGKRVIDSVLSAFSPDSALDIDPV